MIAACGERAKPGERKPRLGPVRGPLQGLRLAETPPHPDLLSARGEKETALRPGTCEASVRVMTLARPAFTRMAIDPPSG